MDLSHLSRNEHLPARIAAQISRDIAEGRMARGEKLPTEHFLANALGVSRSVVREAIAQLRNEGLVETRQGVGAFVTEMGTGVIRIGRDDLADRASFRDLFELRIGLEVEAAGLAALHHSAEDLARLDAALADMTGAEKWTEQGIVADLAFHRVVAAATGNDYFPLFIGFVAERISLAINAARAAAVLEEIVEVTIAEHVAVRDAIASRDRRRAMAAMKRHLMGAAARLNLTIEAS
jgi:GntR family transcriptional regulator, transcriptional repressor for pyruvate dehydrogenase complex